MPVTALHRPTFESHASAFRVHLSNRTITPIVHIQHTAKIGFRLFRTRLANVASFDLLNNLNDGQTESARLSGSRLRRHQHITTAKNQRYGLSFDSG